jgi:hypothetical protein
LTPAPEIILATMSAEEDEQKSFYVENVTYYLEKLGISFQDGVKFNELPNDSKYHHLRAFQYACRRVGQEADHQPDHEAGEIQIRLMQRNYWTVL